MGKQVQLLKGLIRTIVLEEAKKGTLNEIWGGPNEEEDTDEALSPSAQAAADRKIGPGGDSAKHRGDDMASRYKHYVDVHKKQGKEPQFKSYADWSKNQTPEELDEKHMGFKKLVKALHAKGIKESYYDEASDEEIDEDAKALAAWIGRKKMGKAKFQAKATAGRKKEEGVSPTGGKTSFKVK